MISLTKNATVNNGTKENGMTKFINDLFAELETRYDGEIRIQTVQKNNQSLIGFTFDKTYGEAKAKACPTLYPSDFYERYVSGMEIEEIADEMLNILKDAKDVPDFDVEQMTNWEYAKTRVMPNVVSKETNGTMLKTLAYTNTKTDLAIIYRIVLGSDGDGTMSVKVTKPMLETFGITMAELKKAAFKNVESQFEFKNMADTLRELMGEEQAELMGIEDAPMWVLSTEDKTNGAGVMFVPKVLKAVKERIGLEQFYILPSSIHEVLVVSDTSVKVDELRNMVIDVNATQVAPVDKLSDNVYFYNGKTIEVA